MSNTPRLPRFLSNPYPTREPELAHFKPRPQELRPRLAIAPAEPVSKPAPAAHSPALEIKNSEPAEPSAAEQRMSERLASAIETLRLQGERLAEQARSDALEIGFQVARRILETELSTSPEPLFALIRSSIHRAGDSRRMTVRVCTSDLARIEKEGLKKRIDALTVAQIDLLASPDLTPGDVMVETDFGKVDGRLESRFDELRQAVVSSEGVA